MAGCGPSGAFCRLRLTANRFLAGWRSPMTLTDAASRAAPDQCSFLEVVHPFDQIFPQLFTVNVGLALRTATLFASSRTLGNDPVEV